MNIDALTNGNMYSFRVRAVNDAGCSEWSVPVVDVVPCTQHPTCPEGAYSISPGTDLIESGMKDALSKGFKDIFLEPGVHIMTYGWTISEEVTISGAGRGITFVQGGGFKIEGKKGKKCTFMDITVQKTENIGLYGKNGMSFDCLRMHFDQCGSYGVGAEYTKGNRLTNCQITQSRYSGVHSSYNSTIEIGGEETMIEKNNTNGDEYQYGLKAYDSSSFIHILSPLTKESISKNNQNPFRENGNYNSEGTIQTVNSF